MTGDPGQASVLRGATALYLVQLLSIPLGVATNLVAGRLLVPGDYGAFFTADFIVSFVSLVSNGGLVTTLIRDPGEVSEKRYADVFLYQLFSSLLLSAVLLASIHPLVDLLKFDAPPADLRGMIGWLCLVPIFQSFVTIPLVRMERNLVYGRIARFALAWSVLERLVLVGLMFAGAKGFSYVYARVFGALLQVFMLWYFARWNPAAMLLDSIRTGWQGRADLRFGFKVQLKTVSNILQTSIIPGAGNRLFDVQTVGLLAWANNTAYTLGQSLPQAVGRVIVGSNSRYQGDPAGFRRLVEQALGFCTIFCGSVLALTAALLPELLLYLFNPRWSGAAGLFALACLPMLQAILLIVYDALLLAGGRPLSTAFWNWITGGLAFGFSVGLGNWIGPPGIFLGLFLANLVPLAAYHRLTRAQHPLALGRSFFLPATWSTAGGFAVFFFKGHFVQGWPSLLAYGAVGFLLVAGSYFAWHRDQLAALLSLFGGRRKA